MRNPEMSEMPPIDLPGKIVGAEKGPDGKMDYSKAAVEFDPDKKFFGSEKAAEVKRIAEKMLQDEDPLPGYMLDAMIKVSLAKPELDTEEAIQEILSKVNFDPRNGQPLDMGRKNKALQEVLKYYDDLREMRDKLLEARSSNT